MEIRNGEVSRKPGTFPSLEITLNFQIVLIFFPSYCCNIDISMPGILSDEVRDMEYWRLRKRLGKPGGNLDAYDKLFIQMFSHL